MKVPVHNINCKRRHTTIPAPNTIKAVEYNTKSFDVQISQHGSNVSDGHNEGSSHVKPAKQYIKSVQHTRNLLNGKQYITSIQPTRNLLNGKRYIKSVQHTRNLLNGKRYIISVQHTKNLLNGKQYIISIQSIRNLLNGKQYIKSIQPTRNLLNGKRYIKSVQHTRNLLNGKRYIISVQPTRNLLNGKQYIKSIQPTRNLLNGKQYIRSVQHTRNLLNGKQYIKSIQPTRNILNGEQYIKSVQHTRNLLNGKRYIISVQPTRNLLNGKQYIKSIQPTRNLLNGKQYIRSVQHTRNLLNGKRYIISVQPTRNLLNGKQYIKSIQHTRNLLNGKQYIKSIQPTRNLLNGKRYIKSVQHTRNLLNGKQYITSIQPTRNILNGKQYIRSVQHTRNLLNGKQYITSIQPTRNILNGKQYIRSVQHTRNLLNGKQYIKSVQHTRNLLNGKRYIISVQPTRNLLNGKQYIKSIQHTKNLLNGKQYIKSVQHTRNLLNGNEKELLKHDADILGELGTKAPKYNRDVKLEDERKRDKELITSTLAKDFMKKTLFQQTRPISKTFSGYLPGNVLPGEAKVGYNLFTSGKPVFNDRLKYPFYNSNKIVEAKPNKVHDRFHLMKTYRSNVQKQNIKSIMFGEYPLLTGIPIRKLVANSRQHLHNYGRYNVVRSMIQLNGGSRSLQPTDSQIYDVGTNDENNLSHILNDDINLDNVQNHKLTYSAKYKENQLDEDVKRDITTSAANIQIMKSLKPDISMPVESPPSSDALFDMLSAKNILDDENEALNISTTVHTVPGTDIGNRWNNSNPVYTKAYGSNMQSIKQLFTNSMPKENYSLEDAQFEVEVKTSPLANKICHDDMKKTNVTTATHSCSNLNNGSNSSEIHMNEGAIRVHSNHTEGTNDSKYGLNVTNVGDNILRTDIKNTNQENETFATNGIDQFPMDSDINYLTSKSKIYRSSVIFTTNPSSLINITSNKHPYTNPSSLINITSNKTSIYKYKSFIVNQHHF